MIVIIKPAALAGIFFKNYLELFLTICHTYIMAAVNKDGTPRKKGSGRTKGSVSFVEVKLGDLKECLAPLGDNATVLVGRKWVEGLEMVGIRLEAKQLDSYEATSKSNIEAATTQVGLKVTDLSDEVDF
jgi:hypothetical protein